MRLQLQPVTTRWRPASPEQEAERPQIARSMWTLGRRAAASLLPRSAPPGSAQARAGAPRPTKDPRLYGCRGLRTGTAAAGTPSQPVSIRAGSRPGRTPAWRGRARRGRAGHAHRLQLRLGKGGGGRRAFPSLSFSRLQLHWLPLSGERRLYPAVQLREPRGQRQGRLGGHRLLGTCGGSKLVTSLCENFNNICQVL